MQDKEQIVAERSASEASLGSDGVTAIGPRRPAKTHQNLEWNGTHQDPYYSRTFRDGPTQTGLDEALCRHCHFFIGDPCPPLHAVQE